MAEERKKKPVSNPAAAATGDSALLTLVRTIVAGDAVAASRLLAASPALASARLEEGATRQSPRPCFLGEIRHYLYAGDTALHVATVIPNIAWGLTLTHTSLGEDVTAKPLATGNGFANSLDRPGLGIDVDEDRVRHHRVAIATRNVAWPVGQAVNVGSYA